jgi:hypothetical protein
MKPFFASLAAGLLLTLVALIGTALAQATYYCDGPFPGCPGLECYAAAGTCPAGGPNAGTAFGAQTTTTVNVFSCAPGGSGCSQTVEKEYCVTQCYQMEFYGACFSPLCFEDTNVNQCNQP